MPAVPADIVLDQLRWRYATKKFDPSRKIAPDVWQKLEEALVLAPSSYGLQPWKFVVVNDPDVRAKLRPASWGQPQITDASHLVVFATKTDMSPGRRRSTRPAGGRGPRRPGRDVRRVQGDDGRVHQ